MRILYLPNSKCQQRQFEKPNFLAYPVLLAMEAEWHRKKGDLVFWGDLPREFLETAFTENNVAFTVKEYDKVITAPEGLPFLSLPFPDRVFTKAFDKRYQKNGNFKYRPGTYIQAANGCWHGKCTFCVENGKPYEVRPVESVIEEIYECAKLGFREIFDDSGTFPVGVWLDKFCDLMIETGMNEDVRLGCNMRLVDINYWKLKEAGFRMILFGLESANQETLDKINKGVKIEEAIKVIKKASEAGLEPHIAVMFGFPWGTDEDAIRTLQLVHYLLRKGYAHTVQASFYSVPDIEGNERHRKYTKRIYDVALFPEFWCNKLAHIHNIDDLKYLWRQIKEGLNERCHRG